MKSEFFPSEAMPFEVEFELSVGEFDGSIRQAQRFERTRFYVAIALIAVIGMGSLFLDTKVPVVVAAIAIVVLSVLGYRALRVIRLAAGSGNKLRGRARISIKSDGLSLHTDSITEALAWPEVLHCTRTREAWLFVGRGGRAAFILPRYKLSDEQTEELTRFLMSWNRRRYRRVPATY